MQEGHTPTVPMASASLNAEELRNCSIWQTDPCDPLVQMSLGALPFGQLCDFAHCSDFWSMVNCVTFGQWSTSSVTWIFSWN